MKRIDYLWIIAAAIAWYGIFLAWETAVNGRAFAGLPLDDAWIHAQFARNIAHGKFFTFTDDVPVAGDTSPAWPLLSGAVLAIVGEAHAAAVLRVMSGLSYIAIGIATAMLTFRLLGRRRHALAAGIAAVSVGEVVWLGQSGMEGALFAALLAWAVWSHVGDNGTMSPRTGAWFGAATLVRPEGYALFVLAVLHAWWMGREHPERPSALPIVKSAAVYALIAAPFIIFCLATSGLPFPNSYYAKHVPVDAHFVLHYVYYFHGILFASNPVLWGVAIVGMLALIGNRGANPAAVYAVVPIYVFPIASALAGGQIQTRYFAPFLPVLVALAAVGARALTRLPIPPRRGRRLALAVTLVAFAWCVMGSTIVHFPPQRNPRGALPSAAQFAWSVHNINEQQVSVAHWIRDQLPPGEPVATNDVGAIAFFSGHPVYDLCGLTTTSVTHLYRTLGERETRVHLLDTLARGPRPRHLAIYLPWFPGWSSRLPVDSSFSVVARQNTICGEDTMTVMRVAWDRYHR